METVLHSDTIRYTNTRIVIEVCQSKSGKQYVQLIQSIIKDEQFVKQSKLVLTNQLLTALLPVLQQSLTKLTEQEVQPQNGIEQEMKKLNPNKVNEIISSYLKGVPIPDIALRFDFSRSAIEAVLTANEIPILSDKEMKPPKTKWYPKWKNRK